VVVAVVVAIVRAAMEMTMIAVAAEIMETKMMMIAISTMIMMIITQEMKKRNI
jgi:hypothetical protein